MLQELELYRLQVRHAVETDSEEPFKNRNADYARVVAEEFIGSARNSVDIYCGGLAEDVYGGEEMLAVFHKIMYQHKVRVRIVTASPVCGAQRLAAFIQEHGGEIRHLPEEQRQELADVYHFFVVDKKRYRLEPQEEDRAALACANGIKDGMTESLVGLFEDLFALCEEAA